MTRRALTLCALGIFALAAAAPAPAASGRLPALTPSAHDALSRALAGGELTEAGYALERARSLFELRAVRDEFGRVAAPSPRAATAILRDLFLRRSALRGAEARAAAGILARPSASQFACDSQRPLCFHWGNRVSATDVAATEATFAAVYDLEVGGYGYLPPLPDGTSGGNSKTDIYLRDLGRLGLFGYCTNDGQPSSPDVPAYCVVDDDFAEFGGSQTPQEFRDVTAAHEFFHAIQFAYDSQEDLWLMEGTAMFMEDQFADDVNDNINYLDRSALLAPWTPVDLGADGFEYGAWIWWRSLVEQLGEQADPVVIRNVWERVAGASIDTDGAGPDTVVSNPYSLRGVVRALRTRGLAFKTVFGKFAWANRVPSAVYEEGSAYPRATTSWSFTLGKRGTGTTWRTARLRHLASTYASFRPGPSTPLNAVLRVKVDLPSTARSPKAFVLIKERGRPWRVREIVLDSSGSGARSVAFGRAAIREVDLVLTNASTRMRCGQGTAYSCGGIGLDDRRAYSFRGWVR